MGLWMKLLRYVHIVGGGTDVEKHNGVHNIPVMWFFLFDLKSNKKEIIDSYNVLCLVVIRIVLSDEKEKLCHVLE